MVEQVEGTSGAEAGSKFSASALRTLRASHAYVLTTPWLASRMPSPKLSRIHDDFPAIPGGYRRCSAVADADAIMSLQDFSVEWKPV